MGAREIGGETIVRGTWFFEVNWHPLSENLAETIEEEHERAVKVLSISIMRNDNIGVIQAINQDFAKKIA